MRPRGVQERLGDRAGAGVLATAVVRARHRALPPRGAREPEKNKMPRRCVASSPRRGSRDRRLPRPIRNTRGASDRPPGRSRFRRARRARTCGFERVCPRPHAPRRVASAARGDCDWRGRDLDSASRERFHARDRQVHRQTDACHSRFHRAFFFHRTKISPEPESLSSNCRQRGVGVLGVFHPVDLRTRRPLPRAASPLPIGARRGVCVGERGLAGGAMATHERTPLIERPAAARRGASRPRRFPARLGGRARRLRSSRRSRARRARARRRPRGRRRVRRRPTTSPSCGRRCAWKGSIDRSRSRGNR